MLEFTYLFYNFPNLCIVIVTVEFHLTSSL